MPSGKTHALISTAAGVGSIIYGLSSGYPNQAIIALASGCLVGILITPDLDVRGEIRSKAIVDRQFGWMIGYLWRLAWWPYARIIPHHRHWLSHAPIIGTSVRVAYVYIWAMAISGIIGYTLPFSANIERIQYNPPWVLLLIIGLAVSDVLHWVADNTL